VKTAALLIVLLSNNGYWLGGRTAELHFEPAALAPGGHVHWALAYGELRIASGSADVAPGRATAVKLSLPSVRVRTPLHLAYRLTDAAGKEVQAGDGAIHLFPDNLLTGAGELLGRSRVVVWADDADPLTSLLTRNAVPHRAVSGSATLRLLRPDVVLVGPGSIDATRAEFRPPLETLARGGSTVIVFRQERVERLAGYPIVPRTLPATLSWRNDHPLLAAFSKEDLASLAPSGSKQLALRVPQGESPVALSWLSAAALPGGDDSLDALLIARTMGRGRMVVCQLPFGEDWTNDPRAQLFLRAALDYAVTPAGAAAQREGSGRSTARQSAELVDRKNFLTTRGKP
jgi:hypothetical protein